MLGVITARGGSEGLPGKNVKLLRGRPLIAYTIDAARQSGVFDRLILSTDDPEIAETARRLGCDVPFVRPADLARDDTPHLPVLQHAVRWLEEHDAYRPEFVMILQPTSPLRQPEHIGESLQLIRSSGADSVVSVTAVPTHVHPLRTLRIDHSGAATLFVTGEPVRNRINRRQEMPDAWAMNGAVYLFRRSLLFDAAPSLYGDRCVAYIMPASFSVTIDDPDDWAQAEHAIERLSATPGG